MEKLAGILGLFAFLGFAYALSENRSQVNRKIIYWGLSLQLILALLILGVPALGLPGPLKFLFHFANSAIDSVIAFTDVGSQFIFGSLLDKSKMGHIFAVQVLPTIIFMASIMAVLYHWGIMQKIVQLMAASMQKLMGTSGAESLSVAANVFVGQTEAPLVIQPFLKNMTRSELMAVMTGGMATVAGGVLAAYVELLDNRIEGIAGHLLTASFMSAPAALAFAKIMVPESKTPETMGTLPKSSAIAKYGNTIEAAAAGAAEGLKLAVNVGAMLLAFIALMALFNGLLAAVGGWLGFGNWGASLVPEGLASTGEAQLSLQVILAYLFAPVAWLMGIPWSEALLAGSLLGEKIVINEYVAYVRFADLGEHFSERSSVILSYALCGFANFSSIAIQIGGIGSLAPNQRSELAKLGIRSVIGGSLAAFSTACIAGLLI
ncbi:MAG: NupC/NupG family nucleoside CNT transporter [Bdellovibrionales bacterium]|nr:NupC/NupG family nucleoside CNT transporter [Bdellovibrionales bacterium]